MSGAIRILPANEASCDDLLAVFGTRGEAARCLCQRFKTRARAWDSEEWTAAVIENRAALIREQTNCGRPDSPTTSGLVAYLDGVPVGWCAVELRTAYVRLQRKPLVWAGRSEDRADERVWALTCLITRAGYRRRGVTYALARAAVEFARDRGARAIEGYPMIPEPGQDVTWGELHVGHLNAFRAAGFAEVSHPTPRRVVMRVDFDRSSARTASTAGTASA